MKEITSNQNAWLKSVKKLQQRKWRDKERRYLIEGPHLVQEALQQNKHQVNAIILHPDFHAPDTWRQHLGETYIVTDELFKQLSQTETPQGVIAVCHMPRENFHIKKGRYLLLDGVQDPGNLGTIIRTADAAGMTAIYLGKGCVDVYNPKVLRSAQGSHFHLPLINEPLQEVIPSLKDAGIPVYGTDLHGQDITNVTLTNKNSGFALIVGNEGQGVNRVLLDQTDLNLKIPIYGRAESLNVSVAAGILMYGLRRSL